MLQANGRLRLGRNLLLIVATVGLLLLYLMAYLYSTPQRCDADSPGCRQVYMSPSYARLKALDESHTRLASKYSLYLYREQGQDTYPEDDMYNEYLTGIPVLFIPGNAGSYKQARLIAAETSNQYFYRDFSNEDATNFDFFTADFNEDFTAFHGRTVVDQAEYLNEAIRFILGLYENQVAPPESVILIGHSMGGVVARVMLSLPNYLPNSVNTILTLATPHAAAPLTFDGDILKIYSAVDRFWHEGFTTEEITSESSKQELKVTARETLKDVSLISITGGILDNTLPADYTTLSYLVPETHGFTVFTTGIPGVWTPIDHLAIVWCDQLRKVILRSLLAIANKNSPGKTYPLPQRMKIFKQQFLSGFEDSSNNDTNIDNNNNIELKLDSKKMRSVKTGDKVLRFKPGNPKSLNSDENSILNVFYLPVDSKVKSKFSLLSSMEIVDWNTHQQTNNVSPAVLLCSNLQTNDLETRSEGIFDFTTQTTSEYVALRCVDASSAVNSIPRSTRDLHSLSESSFGGEKSPFHSIQILDILSNYDVIIVAESKKEQETGDDAFVIAELSELGSTRYDLGKDMLTLMRRGADLSLPSSRPLSTNIYIPGAWSSILAYNIKLVYEHNKKSTTKIPTVGLFAPFIRQWSTEPYETKWHVNVESNNNILLTMHGIAPFTPFKLRSDFQYGVNIEIWSDPTKGDEALDIILSIDFINSLRLLILRYRLALVCYCVLITLLSFLFQFNYYVTTNNFPNLIYGLSKICSSRILGGILLSLSLLSPLVNNKLVQIFLNLIDPVVLQDSNEINFSLEKGFKLNSYFLGLEEPYLWVVGPIFFVIGVSIVLVTYYALILIGLVVSSIFTFTRRHQSSQSAHQRVERKEKEKLISSASHSPASSSPLPAPSTDSLTTFTSTGNISSSVGGSLYKTAKGISVRRLIANIVLLGSIPFFLPYQFAYMICATIQIITTLKLLCTDNINKNAFNYHLTILILMLWILPINVPVLIVFIHNFTVNWTTPFSSHHNILAIMPILLLMERHASGFSIPKFGQKQRVINQSINVSVSPSSSASTSTNSNNGTINGNKVAATSSVNITIYITRGIIGFFIFYCIIYGIRHTFWLHHLLNIFFCWLLIIYFTHEK